MNFVIFLVIKLVEAIPHSFRIQIFKAVYLITLSILPSYRRIAMRNLCLVFPNSSVAEKWGVLRRSATSFARMVSDLFRLSYLDQDWLKEHVVIERIEEIRDIVSKGPVLYLGAHLGSFDLMVAAFGVLVQPMDFIVRENKSGATEAWANNVRTRLGNGVIPRTGGLRKILSRINKGRSVGFLFDQNVTRNNAIFLEWFGRLAATTAAPGIIAQKIGCPVIILSIKHLCNDRYIVRWDRVPSCDIIRKDSYANSLGVDEVRNIIMKRAVSIIEEIIRAQPEDWFWLHRRWKTTPEGIDEDFYL